MCVERCELGFLFLSQICLLGKPWTQELQPALYPPVGLLAIVPGFYPSFLAGNRAPLWVQACLSWIILHFPLAHVSRDVFWSKPSWLLSQERAPHLSTGTLLIQSSHGFTLPKVLNPIPDLDVSQLSSHLWHPFGHSSMSPVAYQFNLFVSTSLSCLLFSYICMHIYMHRGLSLPWSWTWAYKVIKKISQVESLRHMGRMHFCNIECGLAVNNYWLSYYIFHSVLGKVQLYMKYVQLILSL